MALTGYYHPGKDVTRKWAAGGYGAKHQAPHLSADTRPYPRPTGVNAFRLQTEQPRASVAAPCLS